MDRANLEDKIKEVRKYARVTAAGRHVLGTEEHLRELARAVLDLTDVVSALLDELDRLQAERPS